MDCLSSGVRDQPRQHGENVSLQKIQKLARSGQAPWVPPISPALLEAEVGGSLEIRSLRLAGQHGETPSLLKIQN